MSVGIMPNPPIAWSPDKTSTGDPRVQPIVWRPCLTCWGQRQILTPAGNGEGLIPVDCWTCLGVGTVPA